MRKTLLLMASAALLASCTTDLLEFDSYQSSVENEGITFKMAGATRGVIDENNKNYSYYWFADDTDQINVWYYQAKRGGVLATNWVSGDAANAVSYKVTSAKGDPRFTAIDDANKLNFQKGKPAQFFVAYPKGQSIKVDVANKKIMITPANSSADALNLQVQHYDGYRNFDQRLMYDYISDGIAGDETDVKELHKSVGDALDLKLKSPLATIALSMTDVETYSSIVGNLKYITFMGTESAVVPAVDGQDIVCEAGDLQTVDGGSYLKNELLAHQVFKLVASSDAYIEWPTTGCGDYYLKSQCLHQQTGGVDMYAPMQNAQKYAGSAMTTELDHYDISGLTQHHVGEVVANIGYTDIFTFNLVTREITKSPKPANQTVVKKIKLEMPTEGIAPENNQKFTLFVLPTDNHTEDYSITFCFENCDVELPYKRGANGNSDFELGKKVKEFNMSIASKKYIVTKAGATPNNRTLIVNLGDFHDVLDGNNVIWSDSETATGRVPASEFSKILINAGANNLEVADWLALTKFTNVKVIEIRNNTSKVGSINSLNNLEQLYVKNATQVTSNAIPTGIKELRLPKVTEIAQHLPFTALKVINLKSCNFGESVVASPEVFFNSNTKTTLDSIYIDAVENLGSVFGLDRRFQFEGYKMKYISLKKDGAILAKKAFKDCDNLNWIDGSVVMFSANEAFAGCSNLTTVRLAKVQGGYENKIPAYAFASSDAAPYNGCAVSTIYVGTTGYEIIKPNYVGDYAFYGNSHITGLNLEHADYIGESAFQDASNFKGLPVYGGVVTLTASRVYPHAFDGTKVTHFQFLNSVTTDYYSLASSELKQIQYVANPLSINAYQVADPTKVQIFADPSQETIFFSNYGGFYPYSQTWKHEGYPAN